MSTSDYVGLASIALLLILSIFLARKAVAQPTDADVVQIQRSQVVRMWEQLNASRDALEAARQEQRDMLQEIDRLRSKLGCA